MTGGLWLVVVLLAGAAATVAWPARTGRIRRRAILGLPPGLGPSPAGGRTPPVVDRAADARGRRPATDPYGSGSDPGPDPHGSGSGPGPTPVRWPFGPALPARHALPLAALLGGGTGMLLGGPVAALVLAAYGTLAARAVLRRRTRRAADLAHRRDLDRLGAVAADLRAGLPVGGVLDDGEGRTARLARAAVRLADRTGAPLAELLERVEADARATDRGLASAAAQAAGARATAWLLAALPLGGIGLGYAIGVDPVAVLLHTPVGGGSAVAAVVLQVGGLLWAERLGAGPGRAA
ncbi:type II secretion system F family protein [Micromonospora sediminicola]|uniref:type II secretion system F family protein n=1 Tax=Micromonospora sediminicola TaxID=946078 RepID=UPI003798363C